MGFGLPAAIGRQLGRPDHLVIDIAGDGSIQMNSQEMATATINDVPVKVVVLNNGYLGMVRQWQELFYDKRYASSVLGAGLPGLREARRGVRVARPAGRPTRPSSTTTLAAAFDHDGPALVDVPRRARGERLPDGRPRRLDRRDARRRAGRARSPTCSTTTCSRRCGSR